MLGSLIRKELRQHWLVFLLLTVLLFGGMLVIGLALVAKGLSATMLDGIRMFLALFVPIAAALITGRLVVAEYRAKTQLFLEGLPLSRALRVAVNFFSGLPVLLGGVAAMLAIAAAIGARHDIMTPRFAAILLARASGYAALCYAFFFATGFLGRYRFMIYLLIMLTAGAVDHYTAWEMSKFAPLELIGETFPHERQSFPVDDLQATLLLALACTVLAFALALLREGNVSSMLAERMSHREKVSVAMIILGAVMAIGLIEEKRIKPPYDLSGAVGVSTQLLTVKVTGEKDSAEAIASFLSEEITAVDVQDPGNVGSLLRAAEAGGATGAFICSRSANPFSWKALRGSMGSSLRLPVAAGLAAGEAFDCLTQGGLRTIAAVPRGGESPDVLDWRGRVGLLLGGEGPGLPDDLVTRCDHRVTIPMTPPVESLNVAVAAAILVYAARRQRA